MATTDDRTTEPPSPGRVSRRAVATGLAWSVPAVVVASAAPAFALSGTAPLFQPIAPCINAAGACAGRPTGFGFLIRVCGQGSRTAYLYSATITSPELGDLAFGSIEPPFGTALASGNCINMFFNASSGTAPPVTFTANIAVAWGHSLPVGSDPDHEAVLVQVPVSGTPAACICPPQ